MAQHEINTNINGLDNSTEKFVEQAYLNKFGGKREHLDFAKRVTKSMIEKDREGVVLAICKAREDGIEESDIIFKVRFWAEESQFPLDGLDKETGLRIEQSAQVNIGLEEKRTVSRTTWVIKNWFEAGNISFIQSEPGNGKSRLSSKLAVLNRHKNPFWKSGPEGDGRKSIYICKERQVDKTFKNELACGANYPTECMDVVKNITINGVSKEVDFTDPEHIKYIFDLVKKNEYAFIFVDPIAEMIGDFENKNSEVRSFFNNNILKHLQGLNTAFIAITHYRKQRTGTSRMGKGRGASEKENVATMVASIEKLKEKDEGFVLIKEKLTEGPRKGGIKFKIESIHIDSKHFTDGKPGEHGGIKDLFYIDAENKAILDMCEKDVESENDKKNINSMDTYLTIIREIEAEGRDPNTTEVQEKAKARGVSDYFNRKRDWTKIGYYETRNKGFGKEFKILLKPIPPTGIPIQN